MASHATPTVGMENLAQHRVRRPVRSSPGPEPVCFGPRAWRWVFAIALSAGFLDASLAVFQACRAPEQEPEAQPVRAARGGPPMPWLLPGRLA